MTDLMSKPFRCYGKFRLFFHIHGQWLKSIKFRLPIIENGADLCLDNGSHVEVVSCYTKTM